MKHFVLLTLTALMMLPPTLSADTQETVLLQASLSPSREVPLVTDSAASGNAVISILVWRDDDGTATRAIVDFRVEYFLDQAETLIAMHIHRGPEGEAGPIVIRSRGLEFSGPPIEVPLPPGPAHARSGIFWFQAIVDSSGELATVEAVLKNPEEFYLNIHSTTHPPGLLRGQLQKVELAAIGNLEAKVDENSAELASIRALVRRLALVHGVLRRGE